jgi:hypothetical protein
MTSPVDVLQHSPILSAVFKTLDQVLDTELSASWTGFDRNQSDYLRRRVVNTLIWGDPEGFRPMMRLTRRDVYGPEGQQHVGGLLGADVSRAIVDEIVDFKTPPSRYVVIAKRMEQVAAWQRRTETGRLKVLAITSYTEANVKLRGAGGPGDQIVVLEYPDEGTRQLVHIVTGSTQSRPVLDESTLETEQGDVTLSDRETVLGPPPTKPEAVTETTVILGPDEPTIQAYASANGYANVYMLTSRNPSAVRGLAPGTKVVQIGRTSPDVERILKEGGHLVQLVSE